MAKFEKVMNKTEEEEIRLPERSTQYSAGYDFYAPSEVFVPGDREITYVKTGVKIKMQEDEFLMLCNRSSNPKKKGLVLINGVGIVDSDYYGNLDNDGEIAFAFTSLNEEGTIIKKGEKLGQGIIMKFIKTENDFSSDPNATQNATRVGGFGSTGE